MSALSLRALSLRVLTVAACLLGFAVAAVPSEASGIGTCPASRCHVYRVPAPPGVHISDDRVMVMLPVGYATSHRRYPVIYLFNGAVGPFDEWVVHTDIGRYSARFPAIFVDMASGNAPLTGFWSDWLDGSYQWETWHTRTVIPWVNSHLRTIPREAGAIGVSLGATGELDYQEHNPGLFRSIAAFSGLVDTQSLMPVSGYDMAQSYPAVTRAWGDQTLNAPVWAQHNPTASASKLAGTKLYLASGTGSPDPTNTDLHGPQEESDIWFDQLTFLAAIDAAGIQHVDNYYAGGTHNWPWFIKDLRWALPQMMHDLTSS